MSEHRTLYIGIAPRSYLRAKTTAIARGEKLRRINRNTGFLRLSHSGASYLRKI